MDAAAAAGEGSRRPASDVCTGEGRHPSRGPEGDATWTVRPRARPHLRPSYRGRLRIRAYAALGINTYPQPTPDARPGIRRRSSRPAVASRGSSCVPLGEHAPLRPALPARCGGYEPGLMAGGRDAQGSLRPMSQTEKGPRQPGRRDCGNWAPDLPSTKDKGRRDFRVRRPSEVRC